MSIFEHRLKFEARLESEYQSAIESAELAARHGMGRNEVKTHLTQAARIRQLAHVLADAPEDGCLVAMCFVSRTMGWASPGPRVPASAEDIARVERFTRTRSASSPT
jgi:hypothetical protein